MGTNYYHEVELCDKCHNADRIHIGKSSAGWTFSFHVLDGVRSWKDWQEVLSSGGRIVDEYGSEYTLDDLRKLVEAKRLPLEDGPPRNHAEEFSMSRLYRTYGGYPEGRHFLDPEGHSFSEGEFS
jgi:hypothetical protein